MLRHPARRAAAALVLALALVLPVRAAELSPTLREIVRNALPRALAAESDSSSFEGPAGKFRVETAELDAAPPEEGILVLEEPGKPLKVFFLANASGKSIRKGIKLPSDATEISVSFPEFAERRALAQVQGGSATVLLSWNGRECRTVWQSEKAPGGGGRWFELDDVDDDGAREIVTYEKMLVDAAPEDDLGEEVSGSAIEEAVPVAVLRWDGTRFRKDEELLQKMH